MTSDLVEVDQAVGGGEGAHGLIATMSQRHSERGLARRLLEQYPAFADKLEASVATAD